MKNRAGVGSNSLPDSSGYYITDELYKKSTQNRKLASLTSATSCLVSCGICLSSKESTTDQSLLARGL